MSSLIETLIKQNRTYRRFDEAVAIDRLQILRWLDIVRQTPSARNVQPLKYIIITDEALCHEITALQRWAAMLPEWEGPAVGERPRAYLLQLIDTDIAPAARFDEGIQLQALGLLAAEAGYGICILAGHGKGEITRRLDLPTHLSINAIVAIGKPHEEIILEEARSADDVRYWRDEAGRHHVPKRPLSELIIEPNQPSLF